MNSNSQYRFWNTLTSYPENHSLAHKLREPLREFPETAKDFRQYLGHLPSGYYAPLPGLDRPRAERRRGL